MRFWGPVLWHSNLTLSLEPKKRSIISSLETFQAPQRTTSWLPQDVQSMGEPLEWQRAQLHEHTAPPAHSRSSPSEERYRTAERGHWMPRQVRVLGMGIKTWAAVGKRGRRCQQGHLRAFSEQACKEKSREGTPHQDPRSARGVSFWLACLPGTPSSV